MYTRPVGEIYHYGIKGMKWGVRRKREKRSSEDKMRSAAKVGVALTGAVLLQLRSML